MKTDPFKICPNCKTVWQTLEVFLSDPQLELTGYQVNFADLKGGLFYFTHDHDLCGTTLAIEVKAFVPLSTRPILASRGEQPECCPELCVRAGSLDSCPLECECLWVREIMQTIQESKKR
ncbi:MAG: hypothetical protein IT583_02285 [Verrucomicrobia bacterium]|nr:hypothetical protein [Verrucomicrobiota bacterium]